MILASFLLDKILLMTFAEQTPLNIELIASRQPIQHEKGESLGHDIQKRKSMKTLNRKEYKDVNARTKGSWKKRGDGNEVAGNINLLLDFIECTLFHRVTIIV